MKTCSISFFIRNANLKLKKKQTATYPPKWLKPQRLTIPSVGEGGTLTHCWRECKWHNQCQKLAVFTKAKYVPLPGLNISTPGHLSKRNECSCPQKDLYRNVKSSLIHKSEKTKKKTQPKCPTMGRWINNGGLSTQGNTIPGIWNNIAKAHKYCIEWKRADTKEYLYTWFHVYQAEQQAKHANDKISHNRLSSGGEQLQSGKRQKEIF